MEVEEPAAARPSGNLQQGYTRDELDELLRLCAAEPRTAPANTFLKLLG